MTPSPHSPSCAVERIRVPRYTNGFEVESILAMRALKP